MRIPVRMYQRAVAAVAALAGTGAAFAHHSFAMFDRDKEVVLTGSVHKYQWTNPHAFVELDEGVWIGPLVLVNRAGQHDFLVPVEHRKGMVGECRPRARQRGDRRYCALIHPYRNTHEPYKPSAVLLARKLKFSRGRLEADREP